MQAIRTRYFGPTDTRGSRIQAKAEAGAIYVPYNYGLNPRENHKAACDALLEKLKWTRVHGNYTPMVGGEVNGDYYWVFT